MLERAALLPLLLFAATANAQLFFGSERFVCQPRFQGPGAMAAFAATNGTETLAVVQPYGPESSIYLQRLGASAETLTQHGIPIARDVDTLGGIASNRDGYVVAWTTINAVWALPISSRGEMPPFRRVVAQSDNIVTRPHIASNGVDYLLVWTDVTFSTERWIEQGMALRLDRDGKPIGEPLGPPGVVTGRPLRSSGSNGRLTFTR